MKIRPVILCGGAGTRLWPDKKNNEAKQFIDFGGWTLFDKTLERVKNSLFDAPIISTNSKYLKEIKKHLLKHKIKNYRIILEPVKKNTAPAILSCALINDIPQNQPLLFLSSDHLMENINRLNHAIKKNKKYLTKNNIFIFGIKPNKPSDQFGYFKTTKTKKNTNKVSKFIEKPKINQAKLLIKKGCYWNSGIFLIRKDSVISNYQRFEKKIYQNSFNAVYMAKLQKNIYYLNKKSFIKNKSKSFDYAILEKSNNINAINLNIPWSDLGSWKEILMMYNNNKKKYFNKKNTHYRPWGSYTNLYSGKKFLVKEISIKSKGILSLQKHFHRCEHWLVTKGVPRVTLRKKKYLLKFNQTIFIPKGAIHRIENPNKGTVKIMEAQLGSILRESDIIRFDDVYGRAN